MSTYIYIYMNLTLDMATCNPHHHAEHAIEIISMFIHLEFFFFPAIAYQ